MRGLRLFVRPIEKADAEPVRLFLAGLPGAAPPPACGLLGKLLGDLVAVVGFEITAEDVRIDDLQVAAPLRKKRIGRVMMREVEQLATKAGVGRIVVNDPGDAAGFFEQVGFQKDGERWVKVIE